MANAPESKKATNNDYLVPHGTLDADDLQYKMPADHGRNGTQADDHRWVLSWLAFDGDLMEDPSPVPTIGYLKGRLAAM